MKNKRCTIKWMIKVTQFKIEDVGWYLFYNYKFLFGISSLSGEKEEEEIH